MKIGIILPVYNTAKYLSETLNSILNQTHADWKLFAVDDGSTDGSREILKKFATQDSRIVLLYQANSGVSSARNKALKALEQDDSCDLVTFIDSDDIISKNFLSHFNESIIKFNADYVVCGWRRFGKNGPINNPKLVHNPDQLVDQTGAIHHACNLFEWTQHRSPSYSLGLANRCFRASCIRGLRFRQDLKTGEDQHFLFRALSKINIGWITDDILYNYRLRASSLTQERKLVWDDMIMYAQLLQENLPQNISESILILAAKSWWRGWELAIKTDKLGFIKKDLSSTAKQILVSNKQLKALPNKYIFYLALYLYAQPVVNIIKKIHKNNTQLKPDNTNAFE